MDIKGKEPWKMPQAVMQPDTKEAIKAVHEAAKVVCNKQGQLQTTLEALAEKVDAKTYLDILKANQFLTLQITIKTDQQIFSDETYRQAIVRHHLPNTQQLHLSSEVTKIRATFMYYTMYNMMFKANREHALCLMEV